MNFIAILDGMQEGSWKCYKFPRLEIV